MAAKTKRGRRKPTAPAPAPAAAPAQSLVPDDAGADPGKGDAAGDAAGKHVYYEFTDPAGDGGASVREAITFYIGGCRPHIRKALEDPLVVAFPLAVFCLINSAIQDAPDLATAGSQLLARARLGMPDVDELLEREIAAAVKLLDADDEPEEPAPTEAP